MKHIGLFGGTFNPVHRGHIQAARMVKKRLPLDVVIFIPAAKPPHKAPQGIIAAADRITMLQLAVTDHADFAVSDIELIRTGPSYTIDTVRYFQNNPAEDSHYYLILGLDAFMDIHTWKSYQDLIRTIPLVVLDRPNESPQHIETTKKSMYDFLTTHISTAYVFSEKKCRFEYAGHPPVYFLSGELIALSATDVRKRIRCGENIDPLVPTNVGEFIRRKGLYR